MMPQIRKVCYRLEESFSACTPSTTLIELLPKLVALLPPGVDFESNTWDLLPWVPRPGNSDIYRVFFGDIKNRGLRDCLKVYALHKRLTAQVDAGSVMSYFHVVKFLDRRIFQKRIDGIRNVDFYETENLIKASCSSTAPRRYADTLKEFGAWLNWQLGLPITYEPTLPSVYKHGRKGPEDGRQAKLMSTSVVHDMIAANTRTDLSEKDQFYLSSFVILAATGFRITELATMPKDCLLQQDGVTSLRFFPEKHGTLGTRFIASDMVPSVTTAVAHITRMTEPGRTAVAEIRRSEPPNWSVILDDEEASRYFVGKFAHEWTADPDHRMINPDGAWLEKEKRFVDIIDLIRITGSKLAASRKLGVTRATVDGLLIAQLNAREGKLPCNISDRGKTQRTSWDIDTRVISMKRFEDYCGILLSKRNQPLYRSIIEEAQRLQLAGEVYPCPVQDHALEDRFKRRVRPVIMDKKGNSRLEPEDALFVIPRYGFSNHRPTKDEDYRLITSKSFARWLDGEKRSHGTGNHEDSCFSRLSIMDPKTGEIAKYTSHDVRHWLDTTYSEGMMDECTIALVFGRKKSSNHTYDQTSKKQRLENLRQAVRDGNVLGHITETYNRLASYSREEAEQFLLAYTLMVNIMPHGACTLNWGLEPCPHHLGCFTKDGDKKGPCEHFFLDKNDPAEVEEIKRIAREVEATLGNLPEQSPQYEHYQGIGDNLAILLRSC